MNKCQNINKDKTKSKEKTKNNDLTVQLMQVSLAQKRMLPEFSFYKSVKMQPTILFK